MKYRGVFQNLYLKYNKGCMRSSLDFMTSCFPIANDWYMMLDLLFEWKMQITWRTVTFVVWNVIIGG